MQYKFVLSLFSSATFCNSKQINQGYIQVSLTGIGLL